MRSYNSPEDTPLGCILCLRTLGFGYKLIGDRIGLSKDGVRSILKRRGIHGERGIRSKSLLPFGIVPRKPKRKKPTVERFAGKTVSEWQAWAWGIEKTGLRKFPDWIAGHFEVRSSNYQLLSKDDRRALNKRRHAYRTRDEASRKEYRDYCKSKRKGRYEAYKAWYRDYLKKKKATDPSFRVAMSVRGRIREAIKGNYTAKTERSMFYVGCSWDDLRQHLERQFKGSMTWANYGAVWHIDHIVPCAYFDLTNPVELRQCFHFTNMRPLWAKQNIREQHHRGHAQPQLLLQA